MAALERSWAYLRDVLSLLPRWREHALLDLSPFKWKKTVERDDVRRLRDAGPIRRLTIDAITVVP
jgi:transposase